MINPNPGRATVLRANSRSLPLADDSVDLVVTSPPYFALRSYQDGGEHYAGQIGDEPTPDAFVDSLLDVTRECMRVLKSSGSLWVNLGDKYSTGSSGDRNNGFNERSGNASGKRAQERSQVRSAAVVGMQPKSLLGIPWRYALRCIDELGLILRAEVIWSKPNGLPESVTDRVRRSHEQWFHFTLNPRYYSAVDEIRETHARQPRPNEIRGDGAGVGGAPDRKDRGNQISDFNPLGKLPGSVWEIATEPLKVPESLGVDHFAAFPTEWPRRIIQGWSPAGVCTACGEGRRPVRGYDQEPEYRYVEDRRISEEVTVAWCNAFADWCDSRGIRRKELDAAAGTADMGGWWASRLPHRCAVPTLQQYASLAQAWPDLPTHPGDALWETYERKIAWSYHSHSDDELKGLHRADPVARKVGITITGYACACPEPTAPTTPAVVLDPFGGTGTTALVAKALGRHGISVDMSADYCRLAEWRTNDPDQLAKAMRVDKPIRQVEGQISMLDLLDEESA